MSTPIASENSLMTLVHGGQKIVGAGLFALGVILVAPFLLIYLAYGHYTAIPLVEQAYNKTVPISAVRVDFGTPDMDGKVNLFEYAKLANEHWTQTCTDAEWELKKEDVPSYMRWLPFTVTPLIDRSGSPDKRVWIPNPPGPRQEDLGLLSGSVMTKYGGSWVWTVLPWQSGVVGATEQMRNEGLWGQDQTPNWANAIQIDRLPYWMEKEWSSGGLTTTGKDPFATNGLFKMAPTKWWDWYSGQARLHAKASYNYRAYVAAGRAVTAMRYYVAARKMGVRVDTEIFKDHNHSETGWTKPGMAAIQFSKDDFTRVQFHDHYTRLFNGRLPVVIMHLQELNDTGPLYDKDVWRYFTRERIPEYRPKEFNPSDEARFPHLEESNISRHGYPSWPFVTGMHLADPNGNAGVYRADLGRPVFTKLDYWVNGTPALNDDAKEAQEALLAMLTTRFWLPILASEGLTDSATLKDVHDILTIVEDSIDRDTKFAKKWAHKMYHHTTNLGD